MPDHDTLSESGGIPGHLARRRNCKIIVVAEQAHARLYRSLPPDRSPAVAPAKVSAGVLIAASAIAVPVLVLAYAH